MEPGPERLRCGVDAPIIPQAAELWVSLLSTGHGRNNDDAEPASAEIAARSAPGLTFAVVEGTMDALRAAVEHRDHLVRTRTQTVNRLHVLLTNLVPAGAPRRLTADQAAERLRESGPAMPPAKPCAASPSASSPRYATWTAESPRPPPTSRPPLPSCVASAT